MLGAPTLEMFKVSGGVGRFANRPYGGRTASPPRPRMDSGGREALEPLSFADLVGLVEVLVGLGEIDDSFYQADQCGSKAG